MRHTFPRGSICHWVLGGERMKNLKRKWKHILAFYLICLHLDNCEKWGCSLCLENWKWTIPNGRWDWHSSQILWPREFVHQEIFTFGSCPKNIYFKDRTNPHSHGFPSNNHVEMSWHPIYKAMMAPCVYQLRIKNQFPK